MPTMAASRVLQVSQSNKRDFQAQGRIGYIIALSTLNPSPWAASDTACSMRGWFAVFVVFNAALAWPCFLYAES